jgi:hypothetical protein
MIGLCLVMNWRGGDDGLFGNNAREFAWICLLCILRSLLFCDIVLLCVTVFLLCIVLFSVLVLSACDVRAATLTEVFPCF